MAQTRHKRAKDAQKKDRQARAGHLAAAIADPKPPPDPVALLNSAIEISGRCLAEQLGRLPLLQKRDFLLDLMGWASGNVDTINHAIRTATPAPVGAFGKGARTSDAMAD